MRSHVFGHWHEIEKILRCHRKTLLAVPVRTIFVGFFLSPCLFPIWRQLGFCISRQVLFGLVYSSFVTAHVLAADKKAVNAEQLLQSADRARGAVAATEGITWDIRVTTSDSKQEPASYVVNVKANDALAKATEPPIKKNETMLFNDRSIWFYKKGLKKPVPISARQKLMGQAANGDIASTNYYRDYTGQIVGEEKVNNVETYKLSLVAKSKSVTYDKITYWISKKDQLAVKADFLTVGGDIFKSATFEYENTMSLKNDKNSTYKFVSKMTITDAVNKGNVTTITYSNPRLEAHSDSMFNINNLIR